MISAKEAKERAKLVDPMELLYNEIEELIDEAVEEGEFEIEVDVEELEDFMIEKITKDLNNLGYVTKRIKRPQKEYDEETDTFHKWQGDFLKINWRMA